MPATASQVGARSSARETSLFVAPSSVSAISGLHRFFDLTIAILGLLALWPLFVFIALAMKVSDPGPVFYGHRRIGRDGRQFPCWKFRSMTMNADLRLAELLASNPDAAREWRETQKLRDDPRVTPLGRILRKTSLDELPQLLNVLVGQMSVVGPRPIITAEVDRYKHVFALYCRVRPGLTGLSQISGRSDLSYDERVLLDAQYVGRKSIREDLRIIFLTIPKVLAGDGSC